MKGKNKSVLISSNVKDHWIYSEFMSKKPQEYTPYTYFIPLKWNSNDTKTPVNNQ